MARVALHSKKQASNAWPIKSDLKKLNASHRGLFEYMFGPSSRTLGRTYGFFSVSSKLTKKSPSGPPVTKTPPSLFVAE